MICEASFVDSPRHLPPELPPEPIPNADEGRATGRDTHVGRSKGLRQVWGEWLDKTKTECPWITPDRAGCLLYLWWIDEGSTQFDHLPGKKRKYKPETIVAFAYDWAATSPIWRRKR